MHESEKWKRSHSVVSDSSRPPGLQPTRLLHPWDFPGKSTGVGCHCLLHPLPPTNQKNAHSQSHPLWTLTLKLLTSLSRLGHTALRALVHCGSLCLAKQESYPFVLHSELCLWIWIQCRSSEAGFGFIATSAKPAPSPRWQQWPPPWGPHSSVRSSVAACFPAWPKATSLWMPTSWCPWEREQVSVVSAYSMLHTIPCTQIVSSRTRFLNLTDGL